MKIHNDLIHYGTKQYPCQDCGESFDLLQNFQAHVERIHLKLSPQQFEECTTTSIGQVNLQQCQLCLESFSTPTLLQKHKSEVHETLKKYQCHECDMPFALKGDLTVHIVENHYKIPIPRVDNDSNYLDPDYSTLDNEIKEVKPYLCKECNTCFEFKKGLDNHIAENHSNLKFVKKSSGKSTNSVSKKLKHECLLCEKSFQYPSDLKQHNNFVHLKLKPFSCNECDKSFGFVTNLQTHIDTVHRKLTPHQCNECERSFGQLSALRTHINGIHLKIRPHQCDFCPKSFLTKTELKRHSRIHEKFRPHQCQECEKSFELKKGLRGHIARNHSKSTILGSNGE